MTDAAREIAAKFLWARDGLPPGSWDSGKGIIACDKGGRVSPSVASAELREVYRKAADELLTALGGDGDRLPKDAREIVALQLYRQDGGFAEDATDADVRAAWDEQEPPEVRESYRQKADAILAALGGRGR